MQGRLFGHLHAGSGPVDADFSLTLRTGPVNAGSELASVRSMQSFGPENVVDRNPNPNPNHSIPSNTIVLQYNESIVLSSLETPIPLCRMMDP